MSDSNVIPPKSSSSDDEYYTQWIKYRILEEAYNRDKGPNKLNNSDKQFLNNITINEIQEMYPALGDLELIRSQARGMDMKENPLIRVVGAFGEETITITDTGRIYYEENKNTEIPKLDL